MRRTTAFWAVLLILLGALLLLNNAGVLDVSIWKLVGPLFLIALGAWIVWGIISGRRPAEAEEVTIPLENASQAHIHIRHGAGRLHLKAGAGPDELMSGTFVGGLDYQSRCTQNVLDVAMRVPPTSLPALGWPWVWGSRRLFDWSFGLNDEVALSLDFEIGANEARLDLSDLCVTELRLKTGASATDLTLPASAGYTRAAIEAGAASVTIRVPPAVEGRIRIEGGLAGIAVDRDRFPRTGNVYQSTGYETAQNRVDLDIHAGAGSISVRS
jgi:hypothetical protein